MSGLSLASPALAQLTQKFENFDIEPSGWSGVNNRTTPQDFGWSNSDNTGTTVAPPSGSASGAGEFGGILARQNPAFAGGFDSFYGVDIGGSLSIATQGFSVSGLIHLASRQGGSGFYLGYSRGVASYSDDVNQEIGDARNFLGIQFDDGFDGIAILWTDNGGRDRDTNAGNLPDPVSVTAQTVPFTLIYDPDANGGGGALTSNINGTAHTFNLPGSVKNDVDVLTHFGIFPVAANGGQVNVFIDDLTYTRYAAVASIADWNVDGSGDWNTSGNWTGSVPDAIDADAGFTGAISSAQTVFTNNPKTVGTLRFNNINTYVLAGAGSLAMDVSSGNAQIFVTQGSHKINLPLFLNDNTIADVAGGATLTIADPLTLVGGTSLTKSGTGVLDIISTVSTTGALLRTTGGSSNVYLDLGTNMSVEVVGGTTNFNATQHLTSLSISGTGAAKLSSGGNKVLVTQSLSVTGSGVLDLTDNDAVIDYTGPVGTLVTDTRQNLENGRLITSAGTPGLTGLGYGDNAVLNKSSFAGVAVDTSSLLIKFTYFGDADLDGDVDVADLGALATNWQTASPWTGGDFDYNGLVDVADLGLLATNWQQGAGDPLAPSLEEALAAVGLPSAAVPEPGMLCGLAPLAFLGRRRLRRRN